MATKIRVNVSVDKETLGLADRLARRRKVSRSAVLREGVKALWENDAHEAKEKALRKRQRRAVRDMDRLARKFGDWPAEQILRASRDRWTKPVRGS